MDLFCSVVVGMEYILRKTFIYFLFETSSSIVKIKNTTVQLITGISINFSVKVKQLKL